MMNDLVSELRDSENGEDEQSSKAIIESWLAAEPWWPLPATDAPCTDNEKAVLFK